MTKDELLALAERVARTVGCNNDLDVQCELAMFKPGVAYSDIRANDAATKVIYTDGAGNEVTCWAEDWTSWRRKSSTAAALRALAQQEQQP